MSASNTPSMLVCSECGMKAGVHAIDCPVMRKFVDSSDADPEWAFGMRAIYQYLKDGTGPLR